MRKDKIKLVPHLRFVEFTEEWVEKKLGEIGKPSMCKRILKEQTTLEGEIPFYKIGTFGKKADSYINIEIFQQYKKKYSFPNNGDILISASGTIGRTVIYDGSPAYFQDSNIVWIANDEKIIKNKFLYLCYQNVRWNTENTTIARLYNNNLKTKKIVIPTLSEQTKIATFLTTVDKRIRLLQKKKAELEQYKKGVMQQLFASPLSEAGCSGLGDAQDLKSSDNPTIIKSCKSRFRQLRFKKEDGSDFPDWEEKRLGEIGKFFSGGTPRSTNKKYYSGEIPFIGSGDISKDNVRSFITEKAFKSCSAKMVTKGDILYALYGATSGEVAISKISGAINQAVLCIRTKENAYYLREILNFNKENIVSKYLQGGQGNLSANIVRNLKFYFPCIKEQQKIAAFLSSIDRRITKEEVRIDNMQKFKKGLLQKMFV